MPKQPIPNRLATTKKTAAPSLYENVTTALRTLGVTLAPGVLDAALSAAEKESLSHLEFLHRLLAGPAEAKLQRALQRRIAEASVTVWVRRPTAWPRPLHGRCPWVSSSTAS